MPPGYTFTSSPAWPGPCGPSEAPARPRSLRRAQPSRTLGAREGRLPGPPDALHGAAGRAAGCPWPCGLGLHLTCPPSGLGSPLPGMALGGLVWMQRGWWQMGGVWCTASGQMVTTCWCARGEWWSAFVLGSGWMRNGCLATASEYGGIVRSQWCRTGWTLDGTGEEVWCLDSRWGVHRMAGCGRVVDEEGIFLFILKIIIKNVQS